MPEDRRYKRRDPDHPERGRTAPGRCTSGRLGRGQTGAGSSRRTIVRDPGIAIGWRQRHEQPTLAFCPRFITSPSEHTTVHGHCNKHGLFAPGASERAAQPLSGDGSRFSQRRAAVDMGPPLAGLSPQPARTHGRLSGVSGGGQGFMWRHFSSSPLDDTSGSHFPLAPHLRGLGRLSLWGSDGRARAVSLMQLIKHQRHLVGGWMAGR